MEPAQRLISPCVLWRQRPPRGSAAGAAPFDNTICPAASASCVQVSTALSLTAPTNVAIELIMGGFDELTVPNDFHDGVPALYTRLVTLGNGSSTVDQRLFEQAGT